MSDVQMALSESRTRSQNMFNKYVSLSVMMTFADDLFNHKQVSTVHSCYHSHQVKRLCPSSHHLHLVDYLEQLSNLICEGFSIHCTV